MALTQILTGLTSARMCSTEGEATELRERAATRFPHATMVVERLEMFPRWLWYVTAWTGAGKLAGYVWEYEEEPCEA